MGALGSVLSQTPRVASLLEGVADSEFERKPPLGVHLKICIIDVYAEFEEGRKVTSIMAPQKCGACLLAYARLYFRRKKVK